MPRALAAALVYGAGILQGAAFVLVPSLGHILTSPPYSFSNHAYGLLFFPEIGGAIAGALLAPVLQRRGGSQIVMRAGLRANLAGMILLTLAALLTGPLAYGAILLETLALGVGFGLTLAAINHYAAMLFPQTETRAVTMLNGLIGAATALSPLVLEGARGMGFWGWWPLVLAGGFLLASLGAIPEPQAGRTAASWTTAMLPFFLAVLIYALCEGTFSSWAAVFVTADRHHPALWGAAALSTFWGSMTVFRILFAMVPGRILPQRRLFQLAALGIGASLLLIPELHGAEALVLGYGIAGATCSIYYPFAMAFGLEAWPQRQVTLAGLLVAALMIGEGAGSVLPGVLQFAWPLADTYRYFALWAIPLFLLALFLPGIRAGTP